MSVAERMMTESVDAPAQDLQGFSYRPIPILVPISLGFVFLSLMGVMLAELLVVPLVGTLLAFFAWRQIQTSHGSLSGKGLAIVSIVCQSTMLIGFGALHAYAFATELPEGFERVNFTADISKKGFVVNQGMTGIHPDVQKLANKKILVKGYMYPTKESRNLNSFVLCRDSGACCFGGEPKTTDMILVVMNDNKSVNFRTGMVAVAGEFLPAPTVDQSGLRPVYQLKCDHFSQAKTWY